MTSVVSLFSGCGGFDLGAEAAGCTVKFATDIEEVCCRTLEKNLPNSQIIHSPIQEISEFPSADLVIGGYPCQSFSLGGKRDPEKDARTFLYQEYAKAINQITPKYFIAENVDGLQKLQEGKYLKDQIALFSNLKSARYNIRVSRVNARDYGVPQVRKRLLIVGIREDLKAVYNFPPPTHGPRSKKSTLKPFASHGDAIKDLPPWPTGDFYERPHDPEGHFSWYYMSRNRRAEWNGPAYTVVANWRHITLHPGSPKMKLTWSDLANGWKQRWDFSDEWDHLDADPTRLKLDVPRRLSWKECALIQTFGKRFNPHGTTEEKFTQIGNAVPPLLAKIFIEHLVSERGLAEIPKNESQLDLIL